MSKWLKIGSSKPKKSTKELYAEIERLERKEKDATERALIEKKLSELRHHRRNEILGKIRGRALKIGKSGYKFATSKKTRRFMAKIGD